MIFRQCNWKFFLCLVLSVICISCVATQKDQTEPQDISPDTQRDRVYEPGDKAVSSSYYVHTVKLPGESLSIIAKWYTGDLKNWETLAGNNPSINPNRIFLGDKIKIPRHLMIRHDNMTLEFVEDSQPKPKSRPASSPSKKEEVQDAQSPKTIKEQPADIVAEPPVEDEPFLFGPKDYSK